MKVQNVLNQLAKLEKYIKANKKVNFHNGIKYSYLNFSNEHYVVQQLETITKPVKLWKLANDIFSRYINNGMKSDYQLFLCTVNDLSDNLIKKIR